MQRLAKHVLHWPEQTPHRYSLFSLFPNVPASLLTLASVIPALWAHSLITITSGFTLGSHSEKHFKRKAFRTLVQFSTLMSVSNDFSLSLSLMIGTLAFGTTYATEDSFKKPCNWRSMNPCPCSSVNFGAAQETASEKLGNKHRESKLPLAELHTYFFARRFYTLRLEEARVHEPVGP